MNIQSLFYMIKPVLSRDMQLFLRRQRIRMLWNQNRNRWPIDPQAGNTPLYWQGWPEGKRFALVLTHDVEWNAGQEKCPQLAKMERQLGLHSSFNFVPERYAVSPALRSFLTESGFEVGVHDLNHDGKLFSSKRLFYERSKRINKYLREWKAVGFRAGAMHHNLEWIGELDIEYDSSTFDTDPFEPQPDGVQTIFPFAVERKNIPESSLIELPYTLPQDFTVLVLMRCQNIAIWKTKLDWIAQKGGMALLNTHPDYMHFGDGEPDKEEYSVSLYKEFLLHVVTKYEGAYWNPLPKDIARFLKSEELIDGEKEKGFESSGTKGKI